MANYNIRKPRILSSSVDAPVYYDYYQGGRSSVTLTILAGGDVAAMMRNLSKPRIRRRTTAGTYYYDIAGGQFSDGTNNFYWGEKFTPAAKSFSIGNVRISLTPSTSEPFFWTITGAISGGTRTNATHALLYFDGADLSYILGQGKQSVTAARDFYFTNALKEQLPFAASFYEVLDFQTLPCDYLQAKAAFWSPFVVVVNCNFTTGTANEKSEPQVWNIQTTQLSEVKSGVYSFNLKKYVRL